MRDISIYKIKRIIFILAANLMIFAVIFLYNNAYAAVEADKENTYAATYGDICYYEKSDGTLLVTGKDANVECELIVIPETINGKTVTSIGTDAFYEYMGVSKISIPDTVTTIGKSAFECCGLVYMKLPAGLTSISEYMFYDCVNLQMVVIQNNVTSINEGAFYGCRKLESISIPNGVTNIGDVAFYNCIGLNMMSIPSSVSFIGEKAFEKCDKLTIYCEEDSYAHSYAEENGINCNVTDEYPGDLEKVGSNNVTMSFDSIPHTLLEMDENEKIVQVEYTGDEFVPPVTVTDNNGNIISDDSYQVEYKNNVDVGTAEVIVTMKGSYTGVIKKSFWILPKVLSADNVSLSFDSKEYDGKAVKPTVLVNNVDGEVISQDSYSVEYENNVDVGTANVTVTLKGNYEGIIYKTFSITPYEITTQNVSLENTSIKYTGKEIKQTIRVYNSNGELMTSCGYMEASDFDVTYYNNVNAGEATVAITGKGNYTGMVVMEFEIEPLVVTASSVTISDTLFKYTGKEIKPVVTVNASSGSVIPATSYTVIYTNNVNPGTATVNVIMSGNYYGEITKPFRIVKGIDNCSITLAKTTYTYANKAYTPAVTVKDNSKVLVKGTDYTVTYSNNKNAGTAKVIIKGIGNYTESTTKTFTINQAYNSITVPATSYNKTTSTTTVQYINLSATAKGGTLSYRSGNSKVTVNSSGRVTIPKSFCGRVTIAITAKNSNYKTVTRNVVLYVRPAKERITSISNSAAGKLSIRWTKLAYASGYEIQYATNSKFTSAKKLVVSTPATISKVISNLRKGTTYYVRVRAYKTVGTAKLYGAVSDAKRLKLTR